MFTAIAAIALLRNTDLSPVSLTRTYKENQAAIYKVVADVDQSGQLITLAATIQYKVKKVTPKGAEVELDAKSVETTMGGAPGPDMGSPGAQSYVGTPQGLLKGAQFKQIEALYAVLGLAAYVPDKAMEPGAEFTIKWTSDEYSVEGKGTLVEVKMVDGKQIATVKLKMDVKPVDDHAATLEFTSQLDLTSGILLTSSGRVSSEEFEAKVKISTIK